MSWNLYYRAELYWWKGQNQRTFDIGQFPRCFLDPMRKKVVEDISTPLQNSFIHTGNNIENVYGY
jgi:activated CDC42 kinase 1